MMNIQDKHSRFSISFPKQRFPKHVRRRVSIEPDIPQPWITFFITKENNYY